MFFINKDLKVASIAGKGNGVIAGEKLLANQIIECSPVLILNEKSKKLVNKTPLHDYIFEWLDQDLQQCVVAWGYISLYNHAINPNCKYEMNYEESSIQITTLKAINENEELTINYNPDLEPEKSVWFDVL